MASPFSTNWNSSFSSSFGRGGLSSPYPTTPHSQGMTLRQALLLKLAGQQSSHENKGFLSEVLHGGGQILGDIGHPIGWTFHQIERPFHGVEEGVFRSDKKPLLSGASFKEFGKGFAHGFTSGQSHTGADIAQHVIPGLQHHHILRAISGFGTDVIADPLSFVGLGVKGTKEIIATRRMLLHPQNWWQINQSSSNIKKAITAGANPEHFKARKALNLFDRKLYRQAKVIAKFKNEPFQNKNGEWMVHLFKESTNRPDIIDLLTQRGDLAAGAYHESMLTDPRFKTLGFAGKDIFQFGKNVAHKQHNSALAKLFSNVSRYGPYYPLSVIGIHSGIRTDIVRRMVEQGYAPAAIRDFIKQHEMKRVRTYLAHTEGIPLQVTDKALHRALKKEAKDIKNLHDTQNVPFNGLSLDHPKVLAKFGLDNPGANLVVHAAAMTKRVSELYHATPERIHKLAQVANPAAKDMAPLGGQFKGVAVSKEAKSFMAEYRRQFMKDENLHPFIEKIQHARGILKRGYTGANPFGYAIRNSLTDIWNAALEHTPVVRGMVKNTPKAFNMIHQYEDITKKLVAGEKLTMAEKSLYMNVHHMHDMGILSGLFARDVQEDRALLNQIHPETGRQILRETRGRRLIHAYATGAVHVNEIRENTGRMAHYLYRISKEEAPEEAAAAVKRAHFDYQDVTPFEQNALKSIFPFYTWYRKNIPFQLRKLPEKPGQFMRFYHAAAESQQASGDKKQGILPDYLLNSPTAMRLPFGHNLWMNPALGMQDLQHIEHPISETIKNIGPPANLLYAAISGKDPFSSMDLNQNRLLPTNPLLGKVLDKIPGLNVGNTQREVHGQKIQSKGISPWLNFFINQIPAATLVTSANPVSVGHRGLPSFNVPGFGPFPTGPAASYFGGQTLTSPDQQSLAVGQQKAIQKQADSMLQKLYDNGTLKPRRRRTTRFDRMFAKAAGG